MSASAGKDDAAQPRLRLYWVVDEDVDMAHVPSRRRARRAIFQALRAPSGRREPGSVCVLTVRLTSDDTMRTLNREFRHQDKVTNVLSFPAERLPMAGRQDYLGDLALAVNYVRAEARTQGKSEQDHWVHLLAHGTLHLLGYDHIDANEAMAMENLEREILAYLGVADPYLETETQ